ncbi:MAG: 2-oxoacid:acceptor oxidoreductase subunit alpha, partial [Bacillota bacterium]
FIQPFPPGLKDIVSKFRDVLTIEANWSDRPEDTLIDEDNRRYSALAMLLRSRTLADIDCWSEVRGQPIKPGTIRRVLEERLARLGKEQAA